MILLKFTLLSLNLRMFSWIFKKYDLYIVSSADGVREQQVNYLVFYKAGKRTTRKPNAVTPGEWAYALCPIWATVPGTSWEALTKYW